MCMNLRCLGDLKGIFRYPTGAGALGTGFRVKVMVLVAGSHTDRNAFSVVSGAYFAHALVYLPEHVQGCFSSILSLNGDCIAFAAVYPIAIGNPRNDHAPGVIEFVRYHLLIATV